MAFGNCTISHITCTKLSLSIRVAQVPPAESAYRLPDVLLVSPKNLQAKVAVLNPGEMKCALAALASVASVLLVASCSLALLFGVLAAPSAQAPLSRSPWPPLDGIFVAWISRRHLFSEARDRQTTRV